MTERGAECLVKAQFHGLAQPRLGPADGPSVQVVPLAEVPAHLPHLAPLTHEQHAERITARQRSVARRMIS